ncbi:hypothetical protein MTO96_042287 [Rhipicephalus appendiculatus]
MVLAPSLPFFPPFDRGTAPAAIGDRSRRWIDRFENLLVALQINNAAQKKALLLHYIGEETYDVYASLSPVVPASSTASSSNHSTADSNQPDEYEQVKKRLHDHFTPKMQTALPQPAPEPEAHDDKEVRQEDLTAKLKSKVYADKRRHTKPHVLKQGESALCKQVRRNKLTPNFDPDPYVVTEVQGSKDTAVGRGKEITRNSSFFKKVQCGHKPLESDDEEEDFLFPRNAVFLPPEDTTSQTSNCEGQGDQARPEETAS